MTSARLLVHSTRALARYKLRTGFMMVGSIVGVAALTLVISVGQGAERTMLRTVQQLFGASSIMIIAGGNHLMSGPRPDAARLTLDDIDDIATALPEIDTWDPQQFFSASIRRGDTTTTARVVGQSERAERVWGRSVSRGEYFDASAVKRSDRVALIGETVARDLFAGADPG